MYLFSTGCDATQIEFQISKVRGVSIFIKTTSHIVELKTERKLCNKF